MKLGHPKQGPLLSVALNCPDENWLENNGNCYMFSVFPPISWQRAEKACKNYGANLVCIGDIDERNFIKRIVKDNGSGKSWIGAVDTGGEKKFTWVDGTPWDNAIADWAIAQPGSPGDDQNCVSIGGFFIGWYDEPCETKYNYICEKDINKPTTPTPPNQSTTRFIPPFTLPNSRRTTQYLPPFTLPNTRRQTTRFVPPFTLPNTGRQTTRFVPAFTLFTDVPSTQGSTGKTGAKGNSTGVIVGVVVGLIVVIVVALVIGFILWRRRRYMQTTGTSTIIQNPNYE
ncbi:unnamed protein product [Owenia fusiformis]|uniref:C-type lectin domain-containing protein n=1 Tax=Owenia fusiformis TaxID=6347 RepID=A0A8S4NIJ5_OWEFU|nr:unnamed protein product [Owenia fusiformis]